VKTEQGKCVEWAARAMELLQLPFIGGVYHFDCSNMGTFSL
ncbi:unnamed protein product, partial [Urochloa humidicola]